MSSERWHRIESLFAEAVQCSPEQRQAFLARACEGDDSLRAELESLLACDLPDQNLIELPLEPSEEEEAAELAGRHIGPYRLIRLVGHGGMGAVYQGVRDDDQYQKQVAVKLLKRGMDTDFMLSRFRQERQILANLEHPFIARLLDGGATSDGLPYFVMEYVEGVPITEYAAGAKLSVPERLRLFRLVCEAVQYAHQNLVVHRDIKPSNILTTPEGVPKLVDFGIAKVLASDSHPSLTMTRHELRMLTPDYASPEQVRGERISTASDTYSLGAVLYQLLCGERAHVFPSGSIADMERVVCEVEPERPSVVVLRNESLSPSARKQLSRQLAGDLDNIVLAAMRKEPQRRYASAADLSEDIRRHLDGVPILVREDRWTYRTGKFIRRNRFALIAAALVLASLIGGIVTTSIQARRAERRFQEVRGLANSFLFDIHDQIETLPGSTRVRESIVGTVLKYLNNLAREASGDPSLQWELAMAYQKVGDVQGYGVRPNLGQLNSAMENYRKSLSIAEELSAHDDDHKVLRLLAVAHHRIGYLLESGRFGQFGGSDHFRQAQEILERLLRQTPGDPASTSVLMTVYGHQGDALLGQGRAFEAGETWLKALAVSEQWSKLHPSEAAQVELGRAHRRVSRAAQLSGSLQTAMFHARKAIAIHEPLAMTGSSSTSRQRDLLNSYERLAFVAGDPDALNLGDRQTAAAYTAKVIAIAQALSDADPKNRMASSDLVIAKRSACLFMPDEDPVAVVRNCQDVVDSNDRMNRGLAEERPMVASRLVPALLKLGRREEAIQKLRESEQLLNEALAHRPWRADVRRRLIRHHGMFGTHLIQFGKLQDGLAHYHLAVTLGENRPAGQSQDLALRRDLADIYLTLGRYYEPLDTTNALQWYRKEQAVWAAWPPQKESGGVELRRRADAGLNVARCLATSGKAPAIP